MIHFDVFFDFVNMKKGNQITPTPSLPSLSGHQDSNLGPPGPKPGTLPDCAIPRKYQRREGDSNPRYSYPYVSLANWWFQPLTHPSFEVMMPIFFSSPKLKTAIFTRTSLKNIRLSNVRANISCFGTFAKNFIKKTEKMKIIRFSSLSPFL